MNTRDAMLASRRWNLCRLEATPGNGKLRKVPYYIDGHPRSGALDSAEDMARLSTYEDARATLDRQRGRYAGLGFALGPDGTGSSWQGIDLDDVATNGLSEFANELPGYVDMTLSRLGCHAIGYGRHFRTLGSNGTGVEAYASARYFFDTGNLIRDAPLTCLADYVEQRLAHRHTQGREGHTHVDREPTTSLSPSIISELRSALLHMRSDDYQHWIAIGHALVGEGEVGRGLWMEWSSTSPNFVAAEASEKWETFTGDSTGYRSVFAKAQDQGWVNPKSKAAQSGTTGEIASGAHHRVSIADVHTNPSPPPRFMIEGLLPEREVTLLVADGGVGKSFLALIAVVCSAMGLEFFGQRVHQGKTMYFSAEDSAPILRSRLAKICRHENIDPAELATRLWITDSTDYPCLFTESFEEGSKLRVTTPGFAALERDAAEWGAEVIVIDNASDTFDANENVRVDVRTFMQALKRLAKRRGAAVLLLAHLDKASVRGAGGPAKFSGSTAWHNSARSRLLLERQQDGTLTLSQAKTNHGTVTRDIHLAWTTDGMLEHASSPEPVGDPAEILDIVLGLIKECYGRGQWIATSLAPNATSGAFAVLSSHPGFPKFLTRKSLEPLLRNAQRGGKLTAEPYKDSQRHARERWKVA